MSALVPWLAVCLAGALVGLAKPRAFPYAVIALYVLVPDAASHHVTGIDYAASGGLHAATWLTGVYIGVTLLLKPTRLLRAIRSAGAWWLVAMFVVAEAALVTVLSATGSGMTQWLESLVAPALVYLTIEIAVNAGLRLDRFGAFVLKLACGVAALATVEYAIGHDLVYETDYSQLLWHQVYSYSGYRADATLDHPLNTALLLLIALPLATRYRVWRLPKWGVQLVLVAGIVATQGRTAFLLAVGYLFLRRVFAMRGNPGAAAGLVVAGAAVFGLVTYTTAGQALVQRFGSDNGSADTRQAALQGFLHELPSYVVTGRGVGSSADLSARILQQGHSLESSYLMLTADIGAIATGLLVVALLGLALRRSRQDAVVVVGMLALIDCASYSGFGTKSTAGVLLWLAVRLAAGSPGRNGGTEPEPRTDLSSEEFYAIHEGYRPVPRRPLPLGVAGG